MNAQRRSDHPIRTAPRLNLRVLLVVVISALVLSGVAGVTVLHAVQFERHARAEADRTLAASAQAVLTRTEALLAPAAVIARHILAIPTEEIAQAQPESRASEFVRFFESIEIVPSFNTQIYAAYIGYADGSFVFLGRATPDLLTLAGLPQETTTPYLRLERDWTAQHPIDRWSYRETGAWISAHRLPIDYDPRARPWYRIGAEAESPVWTGLYRFHVEDSFGITLTTSLRNADGTLVGVLGVDLRVDDLTAFLRQLPISENGFAFIAEPNGSLIAHPAMTAEALSEDPDALQPTFFDFRMPGRLDLRVFEAFDGHADDSVSVTSEGQTILGRRLRLEGQFGFAADLYVGAPLSDFTAAADRLADYTLVLTLGLAAVVVFAGIFIARAVARPIRKAISAMDAMSALDEIEATPPERSALAEIDSLNASVAVTQTALRSFGRYVPKELVRDLLHLRHPLRLGGRRREITVLFTDIQGFTQHTETEQHERMIDALAEYFEIICSVIAEHGGTVDKFIGDSVMAFWGAPRDDAEHSRHACDAVVEISRRLDAFNAARQARYERPLITRFALHRGYAFVGNVGARDRFSYTALGDVVNTAARLEGANREMGTRCLVSSAVAANATGHDFIAQGAVKLRGKETTVDAYSLDLGDAPEPVLMIADNSGARLASAIRCSSR